MRWLQKFERALMVCGVLLLSLYIAAQIHGYVLSKSELHRFRALQINAATHHHEPVGSVTPDFSLWSEHRIKHYEESLVEHFDPAIAILRIPKIHVEVPVLEGTDDLILNRGVGHVVGTAKPGEDGNVAIAGHRDGFFRGLKDIDLHDTIEVETMDRTESYTIDRITVVDPSDVSVLKKRSHASLTLITCYPFYFIGSAPKRYIVQASISDHSAAKEADGRQQIEAGVFFENAKLTSNEF